MYRFSGAQLSELRENGFVVIPGLFSPDETQIVLNRVREGARFPQASRGPVDSSGRTTKIDAWVGNRDLLLDVVPRMPRIVGRASHYAGEEVCLWRVFVNYKPPQIGGSWAWHQDYWGWSKLADVKPLFLSCHVALTPCTTKNSCLSFARGANRKRLEHLRIKDSHQFGISPEAMGEILRTAEEVKVELESGDGLFFDSLVPHCSGQNLSESERWTMACVYHPRNNAPVEGTRAYAPIIASPEDALLKWTA